MTSPDAVAFDAQRRGSNLREGQIVEDLQRDADLHHDAARGDDEERRARRRPGEQSRAAPARRDRSPGCARPPAPLTRRRRSTAASKTFHAVEQPRSSRRRHRLGRRGERGSSSADGRATGCARLVECLPAESFSRLMAFTAAAPLLRASRRACPRRNRRRSFLPRAASPDRDCASWNVGELIRQGSHRPGLCRLAPSTLAKGTGRRTSPSTPLSATS